MGGLFSKPKVSKPTPQKVNVDTTQADAAAKTAADSQEAARQRAQLGSNLLFQGGDTSQKDSSGLGGNGPAIGTKKLLGE